MATLLVIVLRGTIQCPIIVIQQWCLVILRFHLFIMTQHQLVATGPSIMLLHFLVLGQQWVNYLQPIVLSHIN